MNVDGWIDKINASHTYPISRKKEVKLEILEPKSDISH